ncbi:hypothetical protein VTJ04DRAFT_1578 [Mycothermus thermophilus]|uniref:uncharacterized protein n=1 Tax=Humicola insolens TaxID=85995 RepID=UPI003744649A
MLRPNPSDPGPQAIGCGASPAAEHWTLHPICSGQRRIWILNSGPFPGPVRHTSPHTYLEPRRRVPSPVRSIPGRPLVQ